MAHERWICKPESLNLSCWATCKPAFNGQDYKDAALGQRWSVAFELCQHWDYTLPSKQSLLPNCSSLLAAFWGAAAQTSDKCLKLLVPDVCVNLLGVPRLWLVQVRVWGKTALNWKDVDWPGWSLYTGHRNVRNELENCEIKVLLYASLFSFSYSPAPAITRKHSLKGPTQKSSFL